MSAVLFATLALANPNGKAGVSATGCTCHGNASASVTLTLEAAATEVDPGEPVDVVLSVAHATGVAAGLDAHADGGTFVPGPDTQLKSGDITHVEPTPLVDGEARFAFTWSADIDGTYTLRAAGMATDGNGRDQGDWWNFADDVTVIVGTGVTPDTGEDTGGDSADTGEAPPDCGCAAGGSGPAATGLGALVLLAAALGRRAG